MDISKLFEQIVVIVVASGIPVALTNLLKNFFPQMDGKSEIVKNWLVAIAFAIAWGLNYFNPNLLAEFLKIATDKGKEAAMVLEALIYLVSVFGLTRPLYQAVKNRIPLLGKSFSSTKK